MYRRLNAASTVLALVTLCCIHTYSSASAAQGRQQVLDNQTITFFVAGDVHFGHRDNKGQKSLKRNTKAVEEMNRTPGQTFPDGSAVAEPRAVVVVGDLVEAGNDPKKCRWQLAQYTSLYGLSGTDAKLRFPVLEAWGNHDGGSLRKPAPGECNEVQKAIRERNTARRHWYTGMSKNGLHYSWDWGELHLLMLGIYPGNRSWGNWAGTWKDPQGSLEFMTADLALQVGSSGRPVIIFQHLGFDAFSGGWWSPKARKAFLAAVQNYNVIAVVHGHTHHCKMYNWKGLRVINVPSTSQDGLPEAFLVMVVELETRILRVAQRVVGNDWGGMKCSLRTSWNNTGAAGPQPTPNRLWGGKKRPRGKQYHGSQSESMGIEGTHSLDDGKATLRS